MKAWPTKPLLEVCSPKQWPTITTAELTETGYPVYGANGQIGHYHSYNHEAPTVLITCRGATCGTLNVSSPKAYVTGNAMALDNPRLDVINFRFLYYSLLGRGLGDTITGTAQPQITRQSLSRVSVPVPPLSEQGQIVKLLDEADGLRKLRAQADDRNNDLMPALFYKMFGQPFAKSIPYPVKKLRELTREGDKINYGVVQPGDEVSEGIPIVRAGDFSGMTIDQRYLKRIMPKIENNYSRSRLRGDEILITCVGTIGNVALADPSLAGFNIVRAVARVPLGSEVDRVFVANQLMTPEIQKFFRRETRTVAQPTLNIRQIEETPIILPPLPLQSEFAQRVKEFRELESAQVASRQRLDDLFQSMLHRAFSGEL